VRDLVGFVLALCALSAMACDRAPAPARVAEGAPSPAEAEAPRAPRPPPLYDAQGRLLPSTTRIAGLTLPRGLEPLRATETEHVYRTDVPIDRLLAYFGPRLFTARVDPIAGGATYRRARPTEARGGEVFLDVSILPASDGGARVHVYELPPPPIDAERDVDPDYRNLD
jgi:hypothetical protein